MAGQLDQCMAILMEFFFVPGARDRRHCRELEMLAVLVNLARSMLVLRRCRSQRWARRVASALLPEWADLVYSPSVDPLDAVVAMRRMMGMGVGAEGGRETAVYTLFTPRARYVGKTTLARGGATGVAQRMFEHLRGIVRRTGKDLPRYRRFKVPVVQVHFVVCFVGDAVRASAAETYRSQRSGRIRTGKAPPPVGVPGAGAAGHLGLPEATRVGAQSGLCP